MSRKNMYLIALAVVFFLTSACQPSPPVKLTASNNGKQVDVKVGGTIAITLKSNPSTGYMWEAKNLDTSMFKQVGDPIYYNNNPGFIGSSGTLTLTFKILRKGTSTLTLVNHIPLENDVEPIGTFTVTATAK